MMTLSINQLLPAPLRDSLPSRPSDLWLRQLALQQGEHIQILAPSGSGKTTLIHILYGLRTDYAGSISWNGVDMHSIDSASLSRLRSDRISIQFQDLRLFPELTAWENLEIKRALTETITAEQVTEWLNRLGLKHKRDSIARTLSYGEQQRVAIIRSLLQPFCWLLMDEPFSHLDQFNTTNAIALISEMVEKNGAGILLAGLDQNNYFDYTKTLRL